MCVCVYQTVLGAALAETAGVDVEGLPAERGQAGDRDCEHVVEEQRVVEPSRGHQAGPEQAGHVAGAREERYPHVAEEGEEGRDEGRDEEGRDEEGDEGRDEEGRDEGREEEGEEGS